MKTPGKTKSFPGVFKIFILLQLKLAGVELIVPALFLQQMGVGALLLDTALLNDHNAVGVSDGGEPMGDHESPP